jgi:hypothetical protein
MTATPTDHGIAFIKTNPDGTKNVYVAVAAGADNAPQDVVAMHLNRPTVELDPSIRTVAAGAMIRTAGPVHVISGPESNEEVRIRAHHADLGPLLRT